MVVLAIESLYKSFGSVEVLRDLSLEVQAGQIFGLLGPNGSGKTTTLSCVLGLQRQTKGRVTVLGVDSRRLDKTRGKVAAVFDEPPFLPGLTARDNLRYAARLRGHDGGRSIDDALERVGMADLAGRRFGKLSLGQGKRLAIASALCGSPELLILDEPLSGLDTLGVRSMLLLIKSLAEEGKTLIVSSHRLHEMELIVTHAGILLSGRLVRCGTLDEILMGSSDLFHLRLSRLEDAQKVIAAHAGAELMHTEPVDSLDQDQESGLPESIVSLRLVGSSMGALNAALVAAGCDVSEITPQRANLQTVFEAAVDEFQTEEVA